MKQLLDGVAHIYRHIYSHYSQLSSCIVRFRRAMIDRKRCPDTLAQNVKGTHMCCNPSNSMQPTLTALLSCRMTVSATRRLLQNSSNYRRTSSALIVVQRVSTVCDFSITAGLRLQPSPMCRSPLGISQSRHFHVHSLQRNSS